MKKIALFITMVLVLSCNSNKIDERFYYNLDLRIALMNSESSLSNDKFHNPQLCNTILFETVTGEKLYWEYNTCANQYNHRRIKIDTKWLYNHKPGDIVHFDYVRKDNFFTIGDRMKEGDKIKDYHSKTKTPEIDLLPPEVIVNGN